MTKLTRKHDEGHASMPKPSGAQRRGDSPMARHVAHDAGADPTALRIGLFGGTFDPVHEGHLALARAARAQLRLSELRWLPAGAPWQKRRPQADGAHRVAMLRLAVAGEAGFVIDERELHRAGPTYTIETLDELAHNTPQAQWHLVIGQDQYARLDTWHRWRDVLARAALAVVARDGVEPITSDAVRAASPHTTMLAMPSVAVSSTAIRARVAAGEPITGLVPAPVAHYIDQHGLYRAPTGDHPG